MKTLSSLRHPREPAEGGCEDSAGAVGLTDNARG